MNNIDGKKKLCYICSDNIDFSEIIPHNINYVILQKVFIEQMV